MPKSQAKCRSNWRHFAIIAELRAKTTFSAGRVLQRKSIVGEKYRFCSMMNGQDRQLDPPAAHLSRIAGCRFRQV
jgi:hypothetical protein